MTKYYITYEAETGKLTGSYISDIRGIKGEEGSTVPEDAIEISNEDWHLYMSDQYYYNISTGKCTPLPPPPVEEGISRLLKQINIMVNEYINSKYDQGTQQSLQALYTLESTPQELKENISYVWYWIKDVMTYYYECKNEIKQLDDFGNTLTYLNTVHFEQFDATKPPLTLEMIYSFLDM